MGTSYCTIVLGENIINCRSLVFYEIKLVRKDKNEIFSELSTDKDEIIRLSYSGSTLNNEIEFTAPKLITLKAGKSSVEFSIETHSLKNGTINIILQNDTYEQCEPFTINVDCEHKEELSKYKAYNSCEDIGFFGDELSVHQTKKPKSME